MTDIWSFLLQTLTASGVAMLLFGVKAVFWDKLSPRWQFAVWGVLAVVLLLPAGRGGRYVLTEWPLVVEALKSALTGEFGTLARVSVPIPLPPPAPPRSAADWVFLVYEAGAAFLLLWYLASYIRLRLALRRGRPAQGERVRGVGARYGLPTCPAVEVDGLPTAFICGVFKPVLALPAGVETDEKVILHELLHLKYKDVAWGWVITLLRCVHWCNPLLWMCDRWARSDLESLCDQRVLERLEGEERRDYGRILLSMADEKYAHAPGTSSAANGGKNIRRRIEAIARFKRYPAGMALVSVCVVLVLASPLVVGARAETIRKSGGTAVIMASARTTWCTTYAGAFDTYAKAAMTGSAPCRAMCAPLSEQNELAGCDSWSWLGVSLSWKDLIDRSAGYQIYNLTPAGEDAWEGLLVLSLLNAPNGETWDGTKHSRWLAVQPLRAEKEGGRWVIVPLDDMKAVQGDERAGGNLGLPASVYEARYGDFTIRVQWQSFATVRGFTQSFGGRSGAVYIEPMPHSTFDQAGYHDMVYALYTGDAADKGDYIQIAAASMPIYGDEVVRPSMDLEYLHHPSASGTSTTGGSWGSNLLEGDWGDWIFLSGGGGGVGGDSDDTYRPPDGYAVELYLNYKSVAELTLLPVEGGEWDERW